MIALVLGLLASVLSLGEAEELYRAGRYEAALAQFQGALGGPDAAPGPVHYGMGNCNYRLGRYAEAALCYRRAALFLPRHAWVKSNLRLAEEHLGIDAPPFESFGAAVEALVGALTRFELLLLGCGLEIVGLVGLVFLRRRRVARWFMMVPVLLGLLCSARLVNEQWFAGPPAGVVLRRDVALRAAPHTDVAALYRLRAGETVEIAELSDRWVRIDSALGSGWTERENVGLVE